MDLINIIQIKDNNSKVVFTKDDDEVYEMTIDSTFKVFTIKVDTVKEELELKDFINKHKTY